MDPITHGLLGASISKAITKNPLRNKYLLLGAAAAMAPDLDIFIRSKNDPTLLLEYHRNFTHSLFLVPFGGLLIAFIWIMLFKEKKSRWPIIILISLLAYLSHGLLDSATSYGTMWLWPFTDKRVAWDIISIVDPVFTFLLVMAVWTKNKKLTFFYTFLFLAAGYLGFGILQHGRALKEQLEMATSRQHTVIHNRVTPSLGELFHFHSFYVTGNNIYIDSIVTPLFTNPSFMTGIHVKHFSDTNLPDYVLHNPLLWHDYKIFKWFSDDYLTETLTDPLVLSDVRFIQNTNSIQGSWGLQFPHEPFKHVRWQKSV